MLALEMCRFALVTPRSAVAHVYKVYTQYNCNLLEYIVIL